MSDSVAMPENTLEPTLLERIEAAAPQIFTFVTETAEAIGAGLGGAEPAVLRKEIREALMSGEHVLEALKAIPDLPDEQFEQALDAVLVKVVPDHA